FWFKPVSIFSLSNITAFTNASAGLTIALAPGPRPPCDAGSRGFRSRLRRPPFGGGYVVPRAPDPAVASGAARGRRPLAEQGATPLDPHGDGIAHLHSVSSCSGYRYDLMSQQRRVRPDATACRAASPFPRHDTSQARSLYPSHGRTHSSCHGRIRRPRLLLLGLSRSGQLSRDGLVRLVALKPPQAVQPGSLRSCVQDRPHAARHRPLSI